MSEPFIAEIRIFAGNFAPRGWAFCNGQLLPVAQNTALFSLIGTTYGGDGRTTTALPNLQGRAPMHPGRGPGLTSRRLGESGGSETVTLSTAQMPNHNHPLMASAENLVPMANEALPAAGGSQSHNNMQPYLAINFIIALTGLYPSRS
jgi:microcystin-dependent protein